MRWLLLAAALSGCFGSVVVDRGEEGGGTLDAGVTEACVAQVGGGVGGCIDERFFDVEIPGACVRFSFDGNTCVMDFPPPPPGLSVDGGGTHAFISAQVSRRCPASMGRFVESITGALVFDPTVSTLAADVILVDRGEEIAVSFPADVAMCGPI
ncbi:MAG: hypothetical protein AAGH15_17095 [Myxococcota bacterium]